MKNEKNTKKLIESVGYIKDDLLSEVDEFENSAKSTAINEKSGKSSSKKVRLKYLIPSVAAILLMIVTVSALAIAYIKDGSSSHNGNISLITPEPIILSGNAYSSGGLSDLPDSLKTVSVSADGSQSKIIGAYSSLIVETAGECDVETFSKYVTLTPETPMAIAKLTDNKYKLTPAQGSFVPGTVYKVTVGDPEKPSASYAFQTETELMIKSTIPGDLKSGVPVKSGIEICFSDTVDLSDVRDHFTITPKISGSFTVYPDGKTVAFVPESDLEYDSVYSFTVKEGIKSKSGNLLKEETSATFRTEKEDADTVSKPYTNLVFSDSSADLSKVFSKDEEVVLDCYHFGYEVKEKYGDSIKIFKFNSFEDALDEITGYLTEKTQIHNFNNCTLVNELDDSVMSKNGGIIYLDLGTGYEEGVYLVEVTGVVKTAKESRSDYTTYGFFQISDIESYLISSGGKSLVFINDRNTGKLRSAEIEGLAFDYERIGFDEESKTAEVFSIKTDKSGFAIFDSSKSMAVLKITSEDDSLISLYALYSQYAKSNKNKYLDFFYTDREVYFSNDIINFSGMLVPIYSSELPDELYLKTGFSSVKERITVCEDGRFEGSYQIEDMKGGYLYLKLVDKNDNLIVSKYIRITEEEKPQIKASITFDKLFYRYGEEITGKLKAEFFDGTPAGGYEFSFGTSEFAIGITKGVTDSNGEISFEITTGTRVRPYSTDPQKVYVYAELTGMETQTLSLEEGVYYFHSDYVFSYGFEGESCVFTLNSVDTSNIRSEEDLSYTVFPENTVGRPASGYIKYTLYKYVITETKYEEYDTYTKKKETKYKYSRLRFIVESGTENFVSGIITLDQYEVSGFTGGYYYEVDYFDGRNTYSYTVSATKNVRNVSSANSDTKLSTDKTAYGKNDPVFVTFIDRNEVEDDVAFIVIENGIGAYCFGDSLLTEFTEDMIAGAVIIGVKYDTENKRYIRLSKTISYDYENLASIDVSVDSDKQVYKPGEKALIKVSAKGAANGFALISIVDEACFALGEQNILLPKALFESEGSYYDLSSSLSSSYFDNSHIPVNNRFSFPGFGGISLDGKTYYYAEDNGMTIQYCAEDKETGSPGSRETTSAYLREYFSDNPEFMIVELDENSEGILEFTVPDNITSWRISVYASSGLTDDLFDLKIGNAVSGMICTQPFFVNVNLCDRYVKGDDVSFSVRSFGEKANGSVSYNAYIYSEDGKLIYSEKSEGNPSEHTFFKFPSLDVGNYSVIITGEGGGCDDAVKLTFEVVDSVAYIETSKVILPSEIGKIVPVAYPVTLSFFDNSDEMKLLLNALTVLRLTYTAERSDMLAAKYEGIIASQKLFGTSSFEDPDTVLSKLESYGSGYFGLLSYSSDDPELTALIALSCEDVITPYRRSLLTDLYSKVISQELVNGDASTLCYSVAALAALGEPVLDELYSVASCAKNYPDEAKLYLALGFAAIGDYSAAYDVYSMIKVNIGCFEKDYKTLYFKGKTDSETVKYTSIALMIASRISKEDAGYLARFLLENSADDSGRNLALASYVEYFLPCVDTSEKTVEYTIKGEKREVTIKPWETLSVTMTKSEFESFKINSFSQGLGIRAYYRASVEDALEDIETTDRVKISKEIGEYKNGMYLVTLNIEGKSTRIYETFDIDDYIPTGARFVSMYTNGSSKTYGDIRLYCNIDNTHGQKMSGFVSVYNKGYVENHRKNDTVMTSCPEYSFSISVSYVIRGALEGNFICESAILSNISKGLYSLSETYSIGIFSEKNWKITER